jgi:hypothetical protein
VKTRTLRVLLREERSAFFLTGVLPIFATSSRNSLITKLILEFESAPTLFQFDISFVFLVIISVGVAVDDTVLELSTGANPAPSPLIAFFIGIFSVQSLING